MSIHLFGRRAIAALAFSILTSACFMVQAASVDQASVDDVAYFLFSAPNKIERYNLALATPLEPIQLAQEPSAFTVHGSTAFVAYHRELRAIDMATGESTFVRNFPDSVHDLLVIGETLYVFTPTGYDGTATALSLADYSLVDEVETRYSGRYFTAGESAFFYRDRSVSPSDIHKLLVLPDGTFGTASESPYHGDYPSGSRVWVSADGSRVFDDAGIAYFTENLNYAGSLGGSFDAMTFVDGNPIIARGSQLFLFTQQLLEAGSQATERTADFLASYDQTVYSFSLSDSGYELQPIDVSGFELPAPGEPVDGDAVAYAPDFLANDGSDITYVVDTSLLSVFRWSTAQGGHLVSWPLQNPPKWVTFSQSHQRLYLGYDSGKITYFDVAAEDAIETHFTTLPTAVLGLADVGNYLFAADSSGAWGSFYTFGLDGVLVSSDEWKNSASEYVWSEAVGRIYHYRDGSSPNDIEWTAIDPETGIVGEGGDSPYHGDTLRTLYPLRVDPTGQFIVNGAGQIVSANTLMVVNSLSNTISDAAWVGGQLLTINAEDSRLQVWAEDYELLNQTRLEGMALTTITEMGGELLAIGYENGRLGYRLIDLESDTDADGLRDLLDNCAAITNPEQLDADSDGTGDLCDLDADNDGLSNELEMSAQLDPLNAEDATGDLDGDGFSNRAEALAGADINDAQSTPEPLSVFHENFDSGWPTGFFTLQPGAYLAARGTNRSQALSLPAADGQPFVAFTAVFGQGVLSADISTDAPWYEADTLVIYVDGVEVQQQSVEAGAGEWGAFSIPLEPGEHTVSFGVQKDSFSQTGYGVMLDNLSFDADGDSDGVGDSRDNCPTRRNPWQYDDDNDGQGNECDALPFDPAPPSDSDGDGLFDYVDNCPDLSNPEQADVDSDGRGDACDDVDNRPQDTDEDTVADHYDNCPAVANPGQGDVDWDGLGDACDDVDDRPVDSDGDGFYDWDDNCATAPNEDQADLDSDYLGDACDTDIDGDGLANEVENQFAFLDARDSTDALQDEDGDGASNLYEVNLGADPQTADAYEALNLTDYAVINEGRAVYSGELARLVVDYLYMPETDTYLTILPGQSKEYAYTEQGLELVASGDIFLNGHTNDVAVPGTMTEGQVMLIEDVVFTGENYYGGVGPQIVTTKTIHLVARGEFELEGQTYPSVTLEYKMGNSDYKYRETYAKGLGLVAMNDLVLTRFAPLQQPDEAEEEPSQEPPVDESPAGSSSGGSVGLYWILVLAIAAAAVRPRPLKKL